MNKITYCESINLALNHCMEKDESIFVYGIGVPDHKHIFGSTIGLQKKFGKHRVFDTPLSEEALTGFGIGAAISGMRPVQIHIRADFMLLAMNQIINMLAPMNEMSNGQLKAPMVIRVIVGRGWGQGYQHSKSMFSLVTHIPGLKILAPVTPNDVYWSLKNSLEQDYPTIIFEHRWLYYQEGLVNTIEQPKDIMTSIVHEGHRDVITIVAISWMAVEVNFAKSILEKEHEINVKCINVISLSPLDIQPIMDAVTDSFYCLIVDCDWLNCGVSSEIMARIYEEISGASVHRIGFTAGHCPTARELEDKFYPNAKTIIRKVEEMLILKHCDLSEYDFYSHENKFKGPF